MANHGIEHEEENDVGEKVPWCFMKFSISVRVIGSHSTLFLFFAKLGEFDLNRLIVAFFRICVFFKSSLLRNSSN
jgi:hypothetical protein